MRSPLRYPGGKSRAADDLARLVMSAGTGQVVSPFFGGGSVELAIAQTGRKVVGYDAFAPLANFWTCALDDALDVANYAWEHHPMNPDRFKELQAQLLELDGFPGAGAFFAVNRSSFSGSTLSGGMSPDAPRFNTAALQRLEAFSCAWLEVHQADFSWALGHHPDEPAFCDPPYLLGARDKLYGNRGDMHMGFDHERLARELARRPGPFVLTYNDCPEVRRLYDGCRFTTARWTYGMGNDRTSNEVVITPR